MIELTWEIPRQWEAVGIVRRDVCKLLADWGMESDAPSVAVIISELLTNALRHGAGTVTLCLARHGEGIRGAVSDHGAGTPRKIEAAGDAAGAPAILATIALDGYADPEFWTPGDRPEAAYYVHKLCTARACAGLGLGRALLDWAGLRTLADGLPWLRLDCAKANPALQDFYRAAGFRHVRTVDLPHRASGALFQRPSAMRTGPDEVRVIDLTNDLPIADTPIRDTAIRGTAGDLVLTR